MPGTKQDLPILELADRAAWDRWLEANNATSPGVWLKLPKKGAAEHAAAEHAAAGKGAAEQGAAEPTAGTNSTLTYAEAVEEALRYGWIDSQKAAFDETASLQRFTPRGPRSKWSQINRQKATELIEQGRMHGAGLAQVEAAQKDGRWDAAYEPQSRATVPEDFQRELDRNPDANAFFATLKGANRYAFLYRIADAKKPETRAKRIATFVEMLNERRTLH